MEYVLAMSSISLLQGVLEHETGVVNRAWCHGAWHIIMKKPNTLLWEVLKALIRGQVVSDPCFKLIILLAIKY